MAARLTAYIVASIVAVTFIAGLIVGAQRDTDGPVDLVILNGRVFTATPGDDQAEAVAVQGNKILRVGSNREIQRLARAQTVVIDARGGSVLPGFNDAHLHALNGGLGLGQIDLFGVQTLEQIGTTIRSWARAHRDRPWVTGRGWSHESLAAGLPTRQMLDQLVPDRPAVLAADDGRTVWANTAALKRAGITKRTPGPVNGTIVKEPRSGEPTGVLKDAAIGLVTKHLPPVSRDERLWAIRRAIGEAHRFGITSVQTASDSPDELDLYDELRRDGQLLVRAYVALSVGMDRLDDLDRLDALRERFPDDPFLKSGAITIAPDGAIEADTAGLLPPHVNRTSKDQRRFDQATLDPLVSELDRRGWQVMIRARGDVGVRTALHAFERAARANPAPERGRRHRIEHIDTIAPVDVPRFGRLGVVASMQPYRGVRNPGHITPSATALDERTDYGWMYRSIAAGGGRVVFGSDWPVVSLDPRLGLDVVANHATLDGLPANGSNGSERLSLDQAIATYTSDAAWASFDEQRKGRLAPDMLADIVVLSTDIFALPAERLTEAEVAFTIFDGKVVYERQVETTEQ